MGTLVTGLVVAGAGAAGLLVAGLTHVPLIMVIVSLFLLAAGTAITSPPSTTLALADYPQIAGTASSLLGAARFAFGGIAAPLVGVAGALNILPARPRHHDLHRPRRARRRRLSHPSDPSDRSRRHHPPRNGRNTHMRGVVMYAPGMSASKTATTRPSSSPPTRSSASTAACICGSDLWPYRGTDSVTSPTPMGHEYVGVVEQVGDEVTTVKVGDFVVGSFFASDNTCEICQAGYQSRCVHAVPMGALGTQAEKLRVPLADGTLVAVPRPADGCTAARPARRFRRTRHRLVRRGRSGGRPGQDRRSGR